MNIFTKTAAVAMTAATLFSSGTVLSPVKREVPCTHLDHVVYGHECGRVRDVEYSGWVLKSSDWFYIYTVDHYVRTRNVVCDKCRCVFSSTLEYKDVSYWF